MSTLHESPAVALTEEHATLMNWLSVRDGYTARLVTAAETDTLVEIAANIRSQVQGMKLYDPATHIAVDRADLDRVWNWTIAADAKVTDVGAGVRERMYRWLTPQQENK